MPRFNYFIAVTTLTLAACGSDALTPDSNVSNSTVSDSTVSNTPDMASQDQQQTLPVQSDETAIKNTDIVEDKIDMDDVTRDWAESYLYSTKENSPLVARIKDVKVSYLDQSHLPENGGLHAGIVTYDVQLIDALSGDFPQTFSYKLYVGEEKTASADDALEWTADEEPYVVSLCRDENGLRAHIFIARLPSLSDAATTYMLEEIQKRPIPTEEEARCSDL